MTRPPLKKVDRSGRLPASFTQEERLLTGFDVQMQNNTVVFGFDIQGSLDVSLLSRGVEQLVQRHEALRSTFDVDEHGGRIRVLVDGGTVLEVHTVETLPPSQRRERALALLAEAGAAPFDLRAGPLFRATLVRLGPAEHALGLSADHAVLDARSAQIALRDLFAIYAGREGVLPDLPIQFVDWAAWERVYLAGPAFDRLMGFWRRTLDGIAPLPACGLVDPGASDVADGAALGRQELTIDPEVLSRVTAFAATRRASEFAVFSAVLKAIVCLHRRRRGDEGAEDVAVFGALENRADEALSNLVGNLATSTVLRTSLAGDPSLMELVDRERSVLFNALAHQELPHSLIVKELNPAQYGIRYRRDTDIPAYLNFDMPEDEPPTVELDGPLTLQRIRVPVPEFPRSGLRLIARRSDRGFVLEARYRTDRYTHPWMQTFLSSYRFLLARWLDDASGRLWRIAATEPFDG
jgi:Condensation domain